MLYDTIRYTTFTCAKKLMNSQLNVPHGTKQKRVMKELKTKKRDAEKKWSGHKVHGVTPVVVCLSPRDGPGL